MLLLMQMIDYSMQKLASNELRELFKYILAKGRKKIVLGDSASSFRAIPKRQLFW